MHEVLVNRLGLSLIVQIIYFLVLWDHWASAEAGARGLWAVLHHYITAHEQTQKGVCYFHFFDVFLASRGSPYILILTVLILLASQKETPFAGIIQRANK